MTPNNLKQLVAGVIELAIADTRYILKAASGERVVLSRVGSAIDAPEWVLGVGLENASAWLDLAPDFPDKARAEIMQSVQA